MKGGGLFDFFVWPENRSILLMWKSLIGRESFEKIYADSAMFITTPRPDKNKLRCRVSFLTSGTVELCPIYINSTQIQSLYVFPRVLQSRECFSYGKYSVIRENVAEPD